MMHLGARKTQAKTERAAQNGPGTRYCFRITHGRFYERIGLFSLTENAWADCFREADLNEAAVRRTRSRVAS